MSHQCWRHDIHMLELKMITSHFTKRGFGIFCIWFRHDFRMFGIREVTHMKISIRIQFWLFAKFLPGEIERAFSKVDGQNKLGPKSTVRNLDDPGLKLDGLTIPSLTSKWCSFWPPLEGRPSTLNSSSFFLYDEDLCKLLNGTFWKWTVFQKVRSKWKLVNDSSDRPSWLNTEAV